LLLHPAVAAAIIYGIPWAMWARLSFDPTFEELFQVGWKAFRRSFVSTYISNYKEWYIPYWCIGSSYHFDPIFEALLNWSFIKDLHVSTYHLHSQHQSTIPCGVWFSVTLINLTLCLDNNLFIKTSRPTFSDIRSKLSLWSNLWGGTLYNTFHLNILTSPPLGIVCKVVLWSYFGQELESRSCFLWRNLHRAVFGVLGDDYIVEWWI
jgi:hypothetical protein